MKVLCIGDSLTYGTGSTPGNTYPEALQRYLGNRFSNVQVISDGKPGFSTKDYCDYLRSLDLPSTGAGADFAEYPSYDAIVILLGCNDCRMDNWVETYESMEYLRRVVKYFLSFVEDDPQRIFLCSTLPLADPMPADIIGGLHPWRQSKVEKEMSPGIQALASREGFRFVDLYSAFQAGLDKGLSLYDGIHPFDSGYQLMAETIGKVIAEA